MVENETLPIQIEVTDYDDLRRGARALLGSYGVFAINVSIVLKRLTQRLRGKS